IVMSVDAFEELDEGDKEAIVEAAKVGAKASREFAADAQAKGVAALAEAGMQVTREIDAGAFAAAMAGATPEFENRFGADVIRQTRDPKYPRTACLPAPAGRHAKDQARVSFAPQHRFPPPLDPIENPRRV